jgi:calcium/calmodulin-dependent protein kinase I
MLIMNLMELWYYILIKSYAAPEVIQNKEYDRSVDFFSLGVLTFLLLSGNLPFRGKNEEDIAK